MRRLTMVTRITDAGMINTYYGLSTDTKPLDCPNASIFYEMDTGDVYLFNEASTAWIKQ